MLGRRWIRYVFVSVVMIIVFRTYGWVGAGVAFFLNPVLLMLNSPTFWRCIADGSGPKRLACVESLSFNGRQLVAGWSLVAILVVVSYTSFGTEGGFAGLVIPLFLIPLMSHGFWEQFEDDDAEPVDNHDSDV